MGEVGLEFELTKDLQLTPRSHPNDSKEKKKWKRSKKKEEA
jgi:hypothetical protein